MRSRPAIERLANGLARDPEVHRRAWEAAAVRRRTPPLQQGDRGGTSRVRRRDEGPSSTGCATDWCRRRGFPTGTTVVAGGAPSQGADFLSATYDAFPWLVLAVLSVTFVVLLVAFRSLLLPLKACS